LDAPLVVRAITLGEVVREIESSAGIELGADLRLEVLNSGTSSFRAVAYDRLHGSADDVRLLGLGIKSGSQVRISKRPLAGVAAVSAPALAAGAAPVGMSSKLGVMDAAGAPAGIGISAAPASWPEPFRTAGTPDDDASLQLALALSMQDGEGQGVGDMSALIQAQRQAEERISAQRRQARADALAARQRAARVLQAADELAVSALGMLKSRRGLAVLCPTFGVPWTVGGWRTAVQGMQEVVLASH